MVIDFITKITETTGGISNRPAILLYVYSAFVQVALYVCKYVHWASSSDEICLDCRQSKHGMTFMEALLTIKNEREIRRTQFVRVFPFMGKGVVMVLPLSCEEVK